jgi:hypothetical protein
VQGNKAFQRAVLATFKGEAKPPGTITPILRVLRATISFNGKTKNGHFLTHQ